MVHRAAAFACLLSLCACGGSGLLTTEPGGGYLASGESVLVDDGRCPAGQVSKVTGPVSLTASRTYACVAKPSRGLF